jgi:hypothetical protein
MPTLIVHDRVSCKIREFAYKDKRTVLEAALALMDKPEPRLEPRAIFLTKGGGRDWVADIEGREGLLRMLAELDKPPQQATNYEAWGEF